MSEVPKLILSLDNSSFCVYLICSCLLVLKIMGVPLLIIFYRFKNKAFISPEDAKWAGGEVVVNDSVERIRRAHLNDIENIPIFLIAAFAYLWTEPPVAVTWVLYLGYTICRTLHTIVYCILVIRQPTRAVVWTIGFLITAYLAIHSAIHAFVYMVK